MNDITFNKKGTIKYLIWTFLITWIMQVVVAVLYQNGLAGVGQLLMAVMMFVPLLGVLLSGHSLSGMGWKPRLKEKFKILLAAWCYFCFDLSLCFFRIPHVLLCSAIVCGLL